MFGHQNMQSAISAISELAAEVAKHTWDWVAEERDKALATKVSDACLTELTSAYQTSEKLARQEAIAAVRSQTVEALVT